MKPYHTIAFKCRDYDDRPRRFDVIITPILGSEQCYKMIIFVTTRDHGYTFSALTRVKFGQDLPPVRTVTYEKLFRVRRLRRATYVFTDIERLYSWELPLAGQLYHRARQAGLRCLNDPARVLTRFELLRELHAACINPFQAFRAEDQPRPTRFPVFIRREAAHQPPIGDFVPNQTALDRTLSELQNRGVPLRGLLVIEFCAKPISPGIYQRLGTFRIGDAMHVDHAVAEDRWVVKYGKPGLATEAMFQAEQDEVKSNAKAELLRPAFAYGGIEFGRADHATVDGREVVYEINTNPEIHRMSKQRSPIRDQTRAIAHERMARYLWVIDSGDGRPMPGQFASLREWSRSLCYSVPVMRLLRPLRRP